jgi:hypothetical protein
MLERKPEIPKGRKLCGVGLFVTGRRILGNSILGYMAALYTGNLTSN